MPLSYKQLIDWEREYARKRSPVVLRAVKIIGLFPLLPFFSSSLIISSSLFFSLSLLTHPLLFSLPYFFILSSLISFFFFFIPHLSSTSISIDGKGGEGTPFKLLQRGATCPLSLSSVAEWGREWWRISAWRRASFWRFKDHSKVLLLRVDTDLPELLNIQRVGRREERRSSALLKAPCSWSKDGTNQSKEKRC